MGVRGNLVSPASCYTSIKTRIETQLFEAAAENGRPPLATLPSKQGLKPDRWRVQRICDCPLATLPSKQGLKRVQSARNFSAKKTSCYTSIKTRIETSVVIRSMAGWRSSCYTSIKTRIETHSRARGFPRTSFSSCYTSIKTRIETSQPHGHVESVAYGLLLHFHQNKD